jgi:hypothetical protein
MGFLAEAGRPGEAPRVFAECRRALATEEVALSPATRLVRDRIAAGRGAARDVPALRYKLKGESHGAVVPSTQRCTGTDARDPSR